MKPILFTAAVAAASTIPARRTTAFHDTISSHVIPLTAHPAPRAHDLHLRRRGVVLGGNNFTASLVNVHDVYYIIDLLVGNQSIPVSVDTGSSDTWMVKQPYECISMMWDFYPGGQGAKPNCGLGDGLKGELSGGLIPDVAFGRAYVDGTYVSGYFGYEDVSIGGLTAKHQRIAIVNSTYWYGDGRVSGLLGLAYPYMTSLDGSSPNQPLYDPVFTTLWKEKLIPPLFSMALSRAVDQKVGASPVDTGHETSYLALGGLPPVEVDEGTWARTPIHNMSVVKEWGLQTEEHGLYVLMAEAYVYGMGNGSVGTGTSSVAGESVGLVRNETQFPVLIDAGSTLNVLPVGLVKKLYNAFDPPAVYMSSHGLFFAKCNAKVPEFGVTFGGVTYFIAPEDLLRQNVRDPTGEYCRIGVTDSDSGVHVLGVTFLSNVVAVFDVEHQEMRFAKRTKY